MRAPRWCAAYAVVAAYLAAALAHEEPLVILVGMLPVAWLAVELAWRGPEPASGGAQASTREPPSRTGMRRWPKGLPNFW
jgi:hypothetical protein